MHKFLLIPIFSLAIGGCTSKYQSLKRISDEGEFTSSATILYTSKIIKEVFERKAKYLKSKHQIN